MIKKIKRFLIKTKTVAIVGLLTAGWALGSKYIDYRKEIETSKIEHTATVEMLETIKNAQDNAMRLSLEDKRILLEMQKIYSILRLQCIPR